MVPNYRLISITSNRCKLTEHITANEVSEFLTDSNVLSSIQYSISKGSSSGIQLTAIIHS